MKNILIIAITILTTHLALAQSKSESVARWGAGTKEVKKITIEGDTTSSYIFLFRNAKYQQVIDYKSVTFANIEELKFFVEYVDSLLSNVKPQKGETLNYSIGEVKNISLSLFLGKTAVSIWDNLMLGYCYIAASDLKKMRAIYTSK